MVSLSRTAGILAAIALLALAGCGGDDKSSSPATTAENGRPALDSNKTYAIVFETNHGSFTVTLEHTTSPNVSASMVALARRGFFDKTICHRIVPGFVIQCGDPTGTGTGGPGYSTHDEVPENAAYTKGIVAMAKTPAEPSGTAGSQFFVVTGQNVGLPPEYAILGKVSNGIEVVEAIGKLGDPATEQPTETVEIEKASVRESD